MRERDRGGVEGGGWRRRGREREQRERERERDSKREREFVTHRSSGRRSRMLWVRYKHSTSLSTGLGITNSPAHIDPSLV